MVTLTLSVPTETKDWIDAQVEAGGYADASDFVNVLLREARDQDDGEEDIEALRRIVEESRASGISNRTLDEIFAEAVEITKARGTYRE